MMPSMIPVPLEQEFQYSATQLLVQVALSSNCAHLSQALKITSCRMLIVAFANAYLAQSDQMLNNSMSTIWLLTVHWARR